MSYNRHGMITDHKKPLLCSARAPSLRSLDLIRHCVFPLNSCIFLAYLAVDHDPNSGFLKFDALSVVLFHSSEC